MWNLKSEFPPDRLAKVYYSDSVTTETPQQLSVGTSDTQGNSPPNQSFMLTINHVSNVVNKHPKLFKSYLVFYLSLRCKVNIVQVIKVHSQTGEMIPEMILLEDQSQPLPSLLRRRMGPWRRPIVKKYWMRA